MHIKEYTLNKGQIEFLASQKKEAAITSGLGGGKSFVLQLLFLLTVLRYPKALHCYGSLSYSNMMDSSIPDFINFMNECGISFEEKKSLHMFLVGKHKTRVIFRSQEVSQKMRSVQIGSLFCDELAYWDLDNYTTFLGRLRDKNGPRIMRAATTPNGLNFFHKLFVEEIEKRADKRELIMTSTYDNKHLDDEYIELLEGTFDSRLIKQERDGLFININGGTTYYAFDREKRVKPTPFIAGYPVTIGMDFNVDPMTATCSQYVDGVTRVFHEFYLNDSNTDAMGKTILAYFGGPRGITLIPDSTGANRKTSSSMTDHAILREMGFDIPRFRNPSRKDRFNNVNGRLDHGKIQVDSSCKYLIKDLECFVEADERKTPELGHISDCLGYSEWHHFPIDIRGIKDKTQKTLL